MEKKDTQLTSTRKLTRETGLFTRTTAGSQSLERGLAILRAFLPNAPALTNAQLAERTGLPRPTVSRLTHSLVGCGFLEYERALEGYRLSPVHLGLARAFHMSRSELNTILPLMRKVAMQEQINVAVSTADGLSMVYLETFREARGPLRRMVTAGTQVAIATTSPGHAYLSALPSPARVELMERLAHVRARKWPVCQAAIDRSFAMLAEHGYCHSMASLGIEGIACPLVGPDGVIYALNLSLPAVALDHKDRVHGFAPVLLSLAEEIRAVWEERAQAARATDEGHGSRAGLRTQ